MRQSFVLTNESDYEATGIRLVFALGRGEIEDATVWGLTSGAEVVRACFERQSVALHWDRAFPPHLSLSVDLEVAGEPLTLVRSVWLTREGLPDVVFTHLEPVVPPPAEALAPARPLTPTEVFARRREAIEHTADPKVKRYQLFFYDYDHRTNVDMIKDDAGFDPDEKKLRIAIINRMASETLAYRIALRLKFARADKVPTFDQFKSSSLVDIEYISKLQIDIFRAYFTVQVEGRDELDIPALSEAFEMFANGELRVLVHPDNWNSMPNSAAHFFFAEFAFMAIHKQVDTDIWTKLLPVLVSSQRIFVKAFKPPAAGPQPFETYTTHHPDQMADEAFKERTRADVRGLGVDQLSIRTSHYAHEAFSYG